ncbi:hypothetical protein ACH5RR_039505 [Cinchona calisaya]|uniref:Uncharacterized protein n=1 Tax=Cinchona calisaya TaxID=153742 RepID=A0ABD2XYF2_9GENT
MGETVVEEETPKLVEEPTDSPQNLGIQTPNPLQDGVENSNLKGIENLTKSVEIKLTGSKKITNQQPNSSHTPISCISLQNGVGNSNLEGIENPTKSVEMVLLVQRI